MALAVGSASPSWLQSCPIQIFEDRGAGGSITVIIIVSRSVSFLLPSCYWRCECFLQFGLDAGEAHSQAAPQRVSLLRSCVAAQFPTFATTTLQKHMVLFFEDFILYLTRDNSEFREEYESRMKSLWIKGLNCMSHCRSSHKESLRCIFSGSAWVEYDVNVARSSM